MKYNGAKRDLFTKAFNQSVEKIRVQKKNKT